MENIINILWDDVEKNKNYSGKWMQLFNWMNKDKLQSVIKDGNVFWFELSSYSEMPNYIYDMLKHWGNKKGMTYLYDIQERT